MKYRQLWTHIAHNLKKRLYINVNNLVILKTNMTFLKKYIIKGALYLFTTNTQ